MFQLRSDQLATMRDVHAAFFRTRRVCLRMPTGAGKTILAGEIARRFTIKHPDTRGCIGLFIVHRKQLLVQTLSKLREFGFDEDKIGIISAGYPSKPWATMQVATIQTLARRTMALEPIFIILDEAHHCRANQWELVVQRFPNAFLLGLTATPARLDGKGLGKIFDELVEGKGERELIDIGALAPYRLAHTPDGMSTKGIRRTMGDYSKTELNLRVTNQVIASALLNYERLAAGRPAIFFGVSIYHSQQVADQFKQAGYNAVHIDYSTDIFTQRQVINRFERGEIDILCNVEMFTEGLDAPRCEVIMLGRPTHSLVLYRQMCGRAFRPNTNKVALILDLSGCWHEHGYPDDPIIWSLESGIEEEPEEPKDKASKYRICSNPICCEVYPRYEKVCPSCKLAPPIKTADEVDITLKMADGKSLPKKKKNRGGGAKLSKGERDEIIQHGASLKILKDIAKRHGYQVGWAINMHRQYRKFGIGA